MAEEWKSMSKQEKMKYIEESNKDKIRYREKRNDYNERMKKQKEEKLKKIREQKEKERKIQDEKPQEENNNCLMPNYSYIDDPDTDGDKVPFFENYHLLKIN